MSGGHKGSFYKPLIPPQCPYWDEPNIKSHHDREFPLQRQPNTTQSLPACQQTPNRSPTKASSTPASRAQTGDRMPNLYVGHSTASLAPPNSPCSIPSSSHPVPPPRNTPSRRTPSPKSQAKRSTRTWIRPCERAPLICRAPPPDPSTTRRMSWVADPSRVCPRE